jgi:DNA methylase N-4/N-6 domain protein
MNRRFIAIEQMDYIETITKERLKKVIEGEQGGISRALGWQGGGEFVYFELKKHNELFKEKIVKAKNKREMLEIFKEIDNNAFLSYKVDMKKFRENINEFEALSLEEQKRILDEFLDKNQLYVNLSSINDADFEILDDEKEASASFYGERK